MNSLDRQRINKVVKMLVYMYQQANDKNDPWKNREVKQAYYDALNALKQSGLIKDFDLSVKG